MEKKTIQFFIVTALFLIGYTYLVSKFYPQKPVPVSSEPILSQKQTTFQQPKIGQSETVDKILPTVADYEELVEADVDDFDVTLSLVGGYIKRVSVKPFKEELIFQTIGFLPGHKHIKFSFSLPERNKIVLENKEQGIKKVWEFDGYRVRFTMVLPAVDTKMILFSNPLSSKMLDKRYQEIFYRRINSSAILRKPLPIKKSLTEDSLEMIGARDRYFCIAFFDGNFPLVVNHQKSVATVSTIIKDRKSAWNFYLGPQVAKELSKCNLGGIIYYGFWHAIGVVIAKMLYAFGFLTHNWGVSVILLSSLIYIVLFPFTAKSTKAMKRMQELQPLVEELRNKHKDNPQKLNKETMELYKKHKVNPLGGCLPLFFQLPIFFALYQVLLRLVELKGAGFLWIKDLSMPDHFLRLPLFLSFMEKFTGGYINLLPLLIILVSYFQQKVTTSQVSAQQQPMAKMFVFLIGIIFYNFPSCLVLYWLTQNTLTFIYQYRTNKTSVLAK